MAQARLARLRQPVDILAEKPAAAQFAVSRFGEAALQAAVAKMSSGTFFGDDVRRVILFQRMSKLCADSPPTLYLTAHFLGKLRCLPYPRLLYAGLAGLRERLGAYAQKPRQR